MSEVNHIVRSYTQIPREYLNGIDIIQAYDIRFLLAYDGVVDDGKMVSSLQDALEINPYFSGRIGYDEDKGLYVDACDEGVLLRVKSFNEDFHFSNGSYPSDSELRKIFPDIRNNTFSKTNPLLQVEITTYLNRSFVCFNICHALCDFNAFRDFMEIWAKLFSSKTDIRKPNFSRHMIQEISDKDGRNDVFMSDLKLADDHVDEFKQSTIENNFTVNSFILKSESHRKILREGENLQRWVSASDLISAHIWKLIAQCQKEPISLLSKIFNLNGIIDGSDYYFGNLMGSIPVEMNRETLIDTDLKTVATRVRSLSEAFSEEYESILSTYGFLDSIIKSGEINRLAASADKGGILINDLSSVDLTSLDFGCGPPIWYDFMIPYLPMRYVMYTSSFDIESGIKIKIALPECEMKKFMSTSHDSMICIT